MTYTLDATPNAARRQEVEERLIATNTGRAPVLQALEAQGERHERALEIYALDDQDQLVGGFVGSTWAGWLHIDLLWVAEGERGAGLGRQLLDQAESLARTEASCGHARVESWSFQAPGFYLKHGYRQVGLIEDYPPGAREHILVKDL
jgi:ribosomal protein S18 acetylase RimI-like enzyme